MLLKFFMRSGDQGTSLPLQQALGCKVRQHLGYLLRIMHGQGVQLPLLEEVRGETPGGGGAGSVGPARSVWGNDWGLDRCACES